MTRPNSLPLLPPLGCAIFFFLVSCFFGFLFPGSLLVFSAMANNTKNPKKKQETRKTRNQTTEKKRQDPTLCHYSPPWGVQSFFLVSCFFGFLFPGSLLVFSAMANNTKNPKKKQETRKTRNQTTEKKRQDPTLCHYSPLGVCNLVFFLVCLFIFFGFLVFGFLVFWFMFFYLKG